MVLLDFSSQVLGGGKRGHSKGHVTILCAKPARPPSIKPDFCGTYP
jgi:hypothetical protein